MCPLLSTIPRVDSSRHVDAARYLLVRLALRKRDKWHRLSALKYERELGDPRCIVEAIDELCRFGRSTTANSCPQATHSGGMLVKIEESVSIGVQEEKGVLQELAAQRSKKISVKGQSTAATVKKPPVIIDLTLSDDDDLSHDRNIVIPPSAPCRNIPIKIEVEADPSDLFKDELMPPPMAPPPVPSHPANLQPAVPDEPGEDLSFIARDDASMTLAELIDTLSTDELKEIAKAFKLRTPGSVGFLLQMNMAHS